MITTVASPLHSLLSELKLEGWRVDYEALTGESPQITKTEVHAEIRGRFMFIPKEERLILEFIINTAHGGGIYGKNFIACLLKHAAWRGDVTLNHAESNIFVAIWNLQKPEFFEIEDPKEFEKEFTKHVDRGMDFAFSYTYVLEMCARRKIGRKVFGAKKLTNFRHLVDFCLHNDRATSCRPH